jgi:hypothetical protein
MGGPRASEQYRRVDQLIDSGQFEAARESLDQFASDDPIAIVLRAKLGLREGVLSPPAAMQRLLNVMRDDPNVPGGRELYQEAAGSSYRERMSSPSHSHPRFAAVRPLKKPDD